MPSELRKLSRHDHSRDSAGLRYVYPVVSRRAGGVSIGINLNPNNACNWRCIYCQVPELTRGAAPPIELHILESELRAFLDEILHGDFMSRCVPDDARRINDIALSGNGEPTSAAEFPDVVRLVGEVMREHGLLGKIKFVLITNGSFTHRASVLRGISSMAPLGGEVWFKLDSATQEGMWRVNQTKSTPAKVLDRLTRVARVCPTWIQTCMFAFDGSPPAETEIAAYLQFLDTALQREIPLQGVLLYGVARPSLQPEAEHITPLSKEWMERFAEQIKNKGLHVNLSV